MAVLVPAKLLCVHGSYSYSPCASVVTLDEYEHEDKPR